VGADGGRPVTSRQAVDPYDELGVDHTADERTIRAAFHRKARASHPDLGGDDQVMARVNSAYDMLKDQTRRAAFDRTRASAEPERAASRDPQKPHWTGAAGPPPGRPSGPRLDFGIFAGWSLGEIARRDPGYLVWLAERKEGRPYAEAIERIIAPMRERPHPRAAQSRR
jgi:curved DNA-binding protein CbpA